MYVMHKDSVHTSRRTQSASIRNNTPLMVCTEMITAHCQNYTIIQKTWIYSLDKTHSF